MHLCPFCNRRTINLLEADDADDDDDDDDDDAREVLMLAYTFLYLPSEFFTYCACVCMSVRAHGFLGSNISKTLRDRDLVPMDNQYEMAYGELIGHLIDDFA